MARPGAGVQPSSRHSQCRKVKGRFVCLEADFLPASGDIPAIRPGGRARDARSMLFKISYLTDKPGRRSLVGRLLRAMTVLAPDASYVSVGFADLYSRPP